MKKEEEVYKREIKYPWKGFLAFLGIYFVTLAAQYPVLYAQAEVYIEIMGEAVNFTVTQFAKIAMLQPLLLGIFAIYGGHRFSEKVQLRSLLNEKIEGPVEMDRKKFSLKESVPFIVSFAVVIALLNLSFDVVFQSWLPELFQPNFSIPNINQIASNVLYQGVGQEILLRWGIMTTLIYVFSSRGRDLNRWVYIVGIIFTAILYGFAQSNALAGADAGIILLIRTLLLNGLPGMAFGWLYYKFHFEAAVFSHVLANILIILGHVTITLIF